MELLVEDLFVEIIAVLDSVRDLVRVSMGSKGMQTCLVKFAMLRGTRIEKGIAGIIQTYPESLRKADEHSESMIDPDDKLALWYTSTVDHDQIIVDLDKIVIIEATLWDSNCLQLYCITNFKALITKTYNVGVSKKVVDGCRDFPEPPTVSFGVRVGLHSFMRKCAIKANIVGARGFDLYSMYTTIISANYVDNESKSRIRNSLPWTRKPSQQGDLYRLEFGFRIYEEVIVRDIHLETAYQFTVQQITDPEFWWSFFDATWLAENIKEYKVWEDQSVVSSLFVS